MKIDVGCGLNKREGYIGIDKSPAECVDIVCDVEKGLPFKDNSIDEIYTSHFLEHTYNLFGVLEELYRVAKPDSIIEIKVPHWAGYRGFTEYHMQFFNIHSFEELDVTQQTQVQKVMFKARFKILERKFNYISGGGISRIYTKSMNIISNIKPFSFEAWFSHLFPPSEIYFKLQVIK